jgi:REP element-mobilizing transposase RayT
MGVDYRKNRMPQWRLDGGIYFVTWRLADHSDRLSPAERCIVADEIKRHKDIRYRLSIFVVMDDHAHVLLQTLPGHDLSKTLQGWKGGTSRIINGQRGTRGTR